MENYHKFLNRISGFIKEGNISLGGGSFNVNSSIESKIAPNNAFLPFYGDTTVFDLSNKEKSQVRDIIEYLRIEVPECFCDPLLDSTRHMTLHDLYNSTKLEKSTAIMRENQEKLKKILFTKPITAQTIQMRSKAIFNYKDIALVIGLYPVNENEYKKLMQLYYLVDMVQEATSSWIPHITLAYYNINGFSEVFAERLCSIIKSLNQKPINITLDTSRLYYQHFKSMNDYTNILCFTDPYEGAYLPLEG